MKFYTGADVAPNDEEYQEIYNEAEGQHLTQDQIMESMEKAGFDNTKCNDYRYRAIRSKDGGETWIPCGIPNVITMCELRDGTLIGLSNYNIPKDGNQYIKLWKSKDQGQNWIGPFYSPMIGPAPCLDFHKFGMTFHRTMLELEDGTILVTAYGTFEGDQKSRIVIYRSTNKGNSFEYYSTIGYDPSLESKYGLTEPVMEQLDNKDLLCVIRTESYLPIMQSRSCNGGSTWTTIELSGVDGVDPDLIKMSNGIAACSFGRPGVWIMFSADGTGRRWTDRIRIWDGHDPKGHLFIKRENERSDSYIESAYIKQLTIAEGSERSCCYTSLRETEPGKLLMVYSAPTESLDKNRIISPWYSEQLKEFSIWGISIEVDVIE